MPSPEDSNHIHIVNPLNQSKLNIARKENTKYSADHFLASLSSLHQPQKEPTNPCLLNIIYLIGRTMTKLLFNKIKYSNSAQCFIIKLRKSLSLTKPSDISLWQVNFQKCKCVIFTNVLQKKSSTPHLISRCLEYSTVLVNSISIAYLTSPSLFVPNVRSWIVSLILISSSIWR
jgi:hypothetical protein